MKLCLTCSVWKSKEDFGRRSASIDGRAAKCRECQKLYDKSRSKSPHRVKARNDYARTERGRLAGGRARKAWDERNAIKKGASTMVGNAVRDGKIIKPDDCEKCGSTPKRLQGHHDDYSAPLIVRWLCSGCHSKWHKENGPGINAE